jgi:hypothetical protein
MRYLLRLLPYLAAAALSTIADRGGAWSYGRVLAFEVSLFVELRHSPLIFILESEEKFGMEGDNDRFPSFCVTRSISLRSKCTSPQGRLTVGAAHSGPTEEQECEKIGTGRLFQFVQLSSRERLCAAFGNIAWAARHPDRVLFSTAKDTALVHLLEPNVHYIAELRRPRRQL